jgi:starch phosphorylase
VAELKASGYNPWDYYNTKAELRGVLDRLSSGYFSPGNPDLFRPIIESLLIRDPYLLLADYQAYVNCQERVSQAYRDPTHWTQMSILNVARIGKFSSDRSIQDYCQKIWHVNPVKITLDAYAQSSSLFKARHQQGDRT